MRLTPSTTINAMSNTELKERLQSIQHVNLENMAHEDLCQLLIHSERSRSLCLWHDHATLLKHGYIMITVHVMYDPMVFYTNDEYLRNHPGADVCIQSEIEQQEAYLLSAGSSGVEDQATLISDRINCLLNINTPVQTESEIEVTDTIRFFTGDHPALQFEQGTKMVVLTNVMPRTYI